MTTDMKKHFYSHIIEIESVYTRLTLLDLTEEERGELERLVESSVHHTVLDTILSKLSEADKRQFLTHIKTDRHEKIWEFLQEKMKGAEGKIRGAVDSLKNKMHHDIEKAKKKHSG